MANKNTDCYGSARWASAHDLAEEGLFTFPNSQHSPDCFINSRIRRDFVEREPANRCMVLGRLVNPEKLVSGIRQGYEASMGSLMSGLFSLISNGHENQLLGWSGDGHIITVAPTRSGKGVGLVVPNLLHYPGSVLVIDPKGENYAITADFRRKMFRQEIICLDPFHVMTEETDSINPLDSLVDYRKPTSTYLTQNPELGDIAANIADAMIVRDAGAKDPHWDDKARTLLRGLILAVICGKGPHRLRHLSEVRELLAQPFHVIGNFILDSMCQDKVAVGGLLSRAGNEILSTGNEELKSIISNALKHTEFLDSGLACKSLGDMNDGGIGTYDLADLKSIGGVSIYMIIPPQYLVRYSRLIRLWITMAMSAMTRSSRKPADGCPVLFMLDEMAQLGSLPMMKQAVSLLAGYGMSIWMVWQDLSQLKALYEHDWPTFLANAKIQQFFGINDHETAKYISEMLGAATITSKSVSHSQSGKFTEFVKNKSESESFSEITRNLLNPDEVRRLNREAVLTFVQGIPPILAERLTYYSDHMFSGKASSNPYFSNNLTRK